MCQLWYSTWKPTECMHQTLTSSPCVILKVIGTEVRQVWLAKTSRFPPSAMPIARLLESAVHTCYSFLSCAPGIIYTCIIHNCIQVASNNLKQWHRSKRKKLALEITRIYILPQTNVFPTAWSPEFCHNHVFLAHCKTYITALPPLR